MDQSPKQQAQDQLITNSVEKLLPNVSYLNDEKKQTFKSMTDQISSVSSTLPSNNGPLISPLFSRDISQKGVAFPKIPGVKHNSKTMAFIEAPDINEMNMVIHALKKLFPNVNLHLMNEELNISEERKEDWYVKNESEIKREAVDEPMSNNHLNVFNKNTHSSDISKPTQNMQQKPDSYQLYRTHNLSTNSCYYGNSDRASSIDNSSLSSNNTSFERQESRDSGYCNNHTQRESKGSFESTKSLSIGESTVNQQKQKELTYNNIYSKNQPVLFDYDQKTLSPSSHRNETDSRKFLTSPTSFNRSSIYNWKKWKKGQAWRYNSSSNLSENSNNINENSNNSLNANSNNSSFSYEKTEDELNEQATSYVATTGHKYQGSSFCFSNSFEYETSKPNNLAKVELLPQWSSTSHIDKHDNMTISNHTISNDPVKSRKRRGKLVRDRTIDNADEQSNSMNCLNPTCLNPSCQNENYCSTNGSLLNQNENSLKSDGSPKNLSRSTSPSVLVVPKNGRISPPEKRVSLDSNESTNNEENNSQNIIKQSIGSFANEDQLNQLDLSILVANIIKNKNFMNNDLVQQILVEQIRQQNNALLQTNSSSTCASPQNANNPSTNLLNTVKQLSHLSLRQDSMNSIKKTLSHTFANQIEFYQDLQMELNLNNSGKTLENNNKSFSEINHQILSENRLSPNNKYNMMKNQGSSSLESSEHKNYSNQSQTKPILRSNSSPSYSSVHPLVRENQLNFKRNNNEIPINSFYNIEKPKESISFESSPDSNPLTDNNNNAINKNSKNLNQDYQGFIKSENYLKSFNGNSQVMSKPLPEIVITESKMDSFNVDYAADLNRKSESIKQEKQDCYKNRVSLDLADESLISSNNSLFTPNSGDFGKSSKLSDLDLSFNQSMSFEEILKTNQENSIKNWKLNANASPQPPSVKSSKLLKPHVCTSCNKRFARSDMLIRHSRLHSGIRPYRCNRCGQEFSRSDHLNTHLRTHTGEKPYSCPHPKCTYAACRKDMITRHLKVHNKNKISLGLSFDSTININNSASLFTKNKITTSSVPISK